MRFSLPTLASDISDESYFRQAEMEEEYKSFFLLFPFSSFVFSCEPSTHAHSTRNVLLLLLMLNHIKWRCTYLLNRPSSVFEFPRGLLTRPPKTKFSLFIDERASKDIWSWSCKSCRIFVFIVKRKENEISVCPIKSTKIMFKWSVLPVVRV